MNIERSNDNSTIRVSRTFSLNETHQFLRAIRQRLAVGAKKVDVDFTDTETVDSAAIGTLVSIVKEFKAADAVLTLKNLNENLRQLFHDTGFDKIFNIEYESGIKAAEFDIFENAVDVRLYIEKEIVGDRCVFHLSGVMNNPQGSRLFKQEFLLSMARHKKMLMDFSELTFFDSLSVSVVLNMNRLLKETGGSMRMCGTNDIVNDLFDTLNIRKIIPWYESQEKALHNWS